MKDNLADKPNNGNNIFLPANLEELNISLLFFEIMRKYMGEYTGIYKENFV